MDPSKPLCQANTPSFTSAAGDNLACYLTVTSMAFRAWNRGLAATSSTAPGGVPFTSPTAFGVWIFNGTRWFPDPTFPGGSVCKGTTILWAGKLDYWLIGAPTGSNWPSLCRFDGVNFEWEPLAVPAATLARAPQEQVPLAPPGTFGPDPGAITSGACYAWNNCWFFGSYGSVLHWNGTALADASPDPSETWLSSGITGAIARVDTGGNPFGVAVGASSGTGGVLPAAPDGTPPPEFFGSSGGAFGPLPFAPPTPALPTDPYRTDLATVDFGSDRQGWVAGNPAGLSAASQGPIGIPGRPVPRSGTVQATSPSPLLTTTASGSASTCLAPPTDRFGYTPSGATGVATDSFLWSSISVVPGSDNALAGGMVWPAIAGPGPDEDGAAEPVIVDARCDGSTTTTRFRIPDPVPAFTGTAAPPDAAADRGGTITAIAANAVNDAWASTSVGGFDVPQNGQPAPFFSRPHLYYLTDGQPPDAPAGDDIEPRPLTLQLDPSPVAQPTKPPPPPPPVPAVVTQTPTRDPLPSVYGVKSKLCGKPKLELCLTFKLRRPVTLGAEALRNGRVISSVPLRHFTGHSGQLVLPISAKAFPTKVLFTSDSPIVKLVDPGQRLSGTVKLRATATPYSGHRIVSVSFERSPSGKGTWTTIGTADAAPWTVTFSTTGLAAGRYDLRAVATDNAAVSGVSPILAKRSVTNTAG